MRSQHIPDWISILIFVCLVIFGWLNIFSAAGGSLDNMKLTDFNQIYTKQALWIALGFILAIVILMVEAKFFRRFSSVIYLVSLVSLAGLLVFGTTIAGQTAWYSFGSFSIQPAEFVKATTGLALAKYLSDIETNIKSIKHQTNAFLIIFFPVLLIMGQPDPGSALIYAAFVFPLYREGLSSGYMLFGLAVTALFVLTLLYGPWWVSGGVVLAIGAFLFIRKRKTYILRYAIMGLMSIIFSFSVNYIFHNVFQQHHRDRFNVVLGKASDVKGIGYNTHQSIVAIGSGGWSGKGWTEGTQTKGNFVPEQHTDYIFSTVGEEWGFLGSTVLILLFVGLIFRVIYLAERQKTQFARVYGYSVAGIIFIHFFINIGMVAGVLPTVGIPLPLLSYGGSSLWGFTILLFIFLKLDADRNIGTTFA